MTLKKIFRQRTGNKLPLFLAIIVLFVSPSYSQDPCRPDAAPKYPTSVRTIKPVFGVNETIKVEYLAEKGFGWDHVVIRFKDPAKQRLAAGFGGAINPGFDHRVDSSGQNELVERKWSPDFPGLQAGVYEVHYVSWDGGSNNSIICSNFTVGDPQTPPQATPTPTIMPTPTTSPAKDLTGLWRNPGSNVTYRLRQIGTRLYWGADGVPMMSFANIYYGDIKGNTVDGIWIDLPGSPYVGDGKIFLRIESDCKLVKTAEVNHYASEIWVKKNSPCDGGPVGPSPSKDLTGLWKNPGGDAIYRFRQVGSKLHWGIDAVPMKSYANKFEGDVNGNAIEGRWVDLPGSPIVADGTLYLRVESDCRIVKTGEVNHYGADIWVKKDSICDVVGLQQKPGNISLNSKPETAVTTASKPTGNTAKPTGPVVVVSDPFGVFDKPTGKAPGDLRTNQTPKASDKPAIATNTKVKEIPDDLAGNIGTGSQSSTTQKPKVFALPGDQSPSMTTPGGLPGEGNSEAKTNPVAVPKPQRTPNPNGGSLQGVGSCQGGTFGLGAPVIERIRADYSVLKFPWSVPTGDKGSMIHVFRAGTSQEITNAFLPASSTNCGYSWPFNWDLNQFAGTFDAYLYDANKLPVVGPVQFTVNK